MTTRKDWMKRINSIAHMRARAAYRDEKAKLMQDVRQAVADGQDVNAFLAYLEREDLRASLPREPQDRIGRAHGRQGRERTRGASPGRSVHEVGGAAQGAGGASLIDSIPDR